MSPPPALPLAAATATTATANSAAASQSPAPSQSPTVEGGGSGGSFGLKLNLARLSEDTEARQQLEQRSRKWSLASASSSGGERGEPPPPPQQHKWLVVMDQVQLRTRLGAGAYGEVWAGRWRRQDIAVKLLTHRGRLSADDCEQFYREMTLLSELRCDYIVRFLGASLEPSSMAILFELCPGSLYDLLHKNRAEPLPEATHMVQMMREVALGLYYLHSCKPPVLHLDLKSANVLLGYSGTAKVCDFGLSRSLEEAADSEEASSPSSATSMGSPQWTAPEVLRGMVSTVAADVYSYGILLFEVMSRRLPYEGTPTHELVMGVITEQLERPR